MPDTANVNIDDAVLVRQSQAGDVAAMEKLILRYQNRIYNLILKICANPDDAAELAQETFVRVIENIDGFQLRSSFYTWIFRIAVNLTLNHCKRSTRLGFTSIDAERDSQDAPAKMLKQILADERSPEPDAIAQKKELCEIIIKALMKLDEAQRVVIVLRDIEGMNYAHIAETLEVKPGTVKSRLSRARNALREIMEAMLS
ncbi:MAG: RNA polymerase sigma factor [Planctomycetota bacterium]